MSRLKNHSTLQAILSDTLIGSPDHEVFIICFQLADPEYLYKMDGYGEPKISGDEDIRRAVYAYFNPPYASQMVSITEAALIRYFQPEYNVRLKNSFPSTNLKLLKQCYDLDFNALIVEVDVECISGFLKSDTVPLQNHHVAKFDFHNKEERLSFFELSERNHRP